MKRAVLLVVFISISFGSIYVLPSGNPQPSDFLLILLVLFSFFHSYRYKLAAPPLLLPLPWLLLVLWVFVVCITWSFLLQSYNFLIYTAFWAFNYLASASILYFLKVYPVRFEKVLVFSLAVSLLFSAIGVTMDLGSSSRPNGFFNNPNQLSYYCLVSASLILLIEKFDLRNKPFVAFSILLSSYCILAASSLAAMAGAFFIVLSYLLANLKLSSLARILAPILLIFTVLVFSDVPIFSEVYDNVSKRFDRAETKFDDIQDERNYDRILAFPEYMLFGAGEGHLERFYPHDRNEIHSSFGNLVFCYGFFGLSLFLFLIWTVLKRAPIYVWVLLAAPLSYSVAHMGLRTTLFWVLLVFVYQKYRNVSRVQRVLP